MEDLEGVVATLDALVVMCEAMRRLHPQRDVGAVVRIVLGDAVGAIGHAGMSQSIPESVRTDLRYSTAAMPAGAALGIISRVRAAIPAKRRMARA